MLATGLFVDDVLLPVNADGSKHDAGLFYDGSAMIGWQLIGILVITVWTAAISILLFGLLHFLGWLRMPAEEEKLGREVFILVQTRRQTCKSAVTSNPLPNSPRIHVPPTPTTPDLFGGLPSTTLSHTATVLNDLGTTQISAEKLTMAKAEAAAAKVEAVAAKAEVATAKAEAAQEVAAIRAEATQKEAAVNGEDDQDQL